MATPTPAQPSASLTSVCRYCCLNRSGLDRKCFKASSHAFLRSVTLALFTFTISRSESEIGKLRGSGGGDSSVDWERGEGG